MLLLTAHIKKLPSLPGVYLFKDVHDQIVYIGKAKNLKKRLSQYVQRIGIDVKVDSIFETSVALDHIITATELEALLLEAQLIQSHQPRYNVLLKSGQPFLYIFISSGKLPEIKLVRNQKHKGSYFGPFLEKGTARKVYDFLVKIFRLKICKKKIENGCLFYHMGLCSGSCRSDFDAQGYAQRLEMAKNSLKYGHKKFLMQLKEAIAEHSQKLEFEKARELHGYYSAFERVFDALDHKPANADDVTRKDIWIIVPDVNQLFVFGERHGVLKKKRVFVLPLEQGKIQEEEIQEYFLSFYRTYTAPATILTNFDFGPDRPVLEAFLKTWHKKDFDISVIQPVDGHFASLVRLGVVHAQQEIMRQTSLARALKQLLKLPREPHTIDCFDISHKQGMFMVGSCVRFKDGQPDKNSFRRFHIKTVEGQDDYASLREIVARRYHNLAELPDIVLIDGGKGQLNAVADLFPMAEFVSLAKREETIFSRRFPQGKKLDQQQHAGQVLIALRDYAHHFAISFHRKIERL